jgi:hypothetical protein
MTNTKRPADYKPWYSRGRWIVAGYCGRDKRGRAVYMAVSGDLPSREAAEKYIQGQLRADRVAKNLVLNWDL